MLAATSENTPLPRLREDLEITPGAPLLSGAPGWVIHDPVRHRFFQIGQRTIEILSSWSAGTRGRLQARLLAEQSIQLNDTELDGILRFLTQHHLLERGEPGTAQKFAVNDQRQRNSLVKLTTQGFLFFRIPLVHPNTFLHATWPLVSPFFSRSFVWLTALALCVGIYLANRQFSDVQDYLRAAFTWSGVLTYALAIVFVKMLHELGHAYQAVSRGLRVPVMGVAFFVMLPLLYTDVTDAWRLRNRRERIMVDLGGVLVELTLAAYATLLWCFLPDGAMRTATFAVATSSWVLSLLVNLNPLMRFDGYFLLSDAIGLQNLQPRSFEMGKWAIRKTLFGLNAPPPERLTANWRRFMVVYALAVWIYRLFLFLGISILVYTYAFKALGILLFCATIMRLVILPIIRELSAWVAMRKIILASNHGKMALTTFVVLLAAAFWPTSTRIQIPAVLEEYRQHLLFPPAASKLSKVFVSDGDIVKQGDPLFQFTDPKLSIKLSQSRIRVDMYNTRLLSVAGDALERSQSTVTSRLLDEEKETFSALEDQEADLLVLAAADGVVKELLPELQPGTWFSRKQLLGRIIDPGYFVVRGFVSESDRERIDLTKLGQFVAEEVMIPRLSIDGFEIADFSISSLPDGYHATSNGGDIAVSAADPSKLVPEGVWYPIYGSPIMPSGFDTTPTATVQRGVVVLRGNPMAPITRLWRRVAAVLIREIGL